MCLLGIALHQFEDYPVVIVSNRDEFHDRPTSPLHQWPDSPTLIAGRDNQAGGTWLGISTTGRLAAVTNLRGYPAASSSGPSRGRLVTDFLSSTQPVCQWIDSMRVQAKQFAGFNLLLSDDGKTFVVFSNLNRQQTLTPGIHSLANGFIEDDWPKEQRLRQSLAALPQADNIDALRTLIEDSRPTDDALLPETGIGLSLERQLSPQLIIGDSYGTRSTAVVRIDRSGQVDFTEFTRAIDGRVLTQTSLNSGSIAHG